MAEEEQYLLLIKLILNQGELDPGGKTVSVFSPFPLSFELKESTLPVLTTKRMFIRGIFEELMWFLRGQTDAKVLQEKGVHIWDENARQFSGGTECGKIYGSQWRSWNQSNDPDCVVDQFRYVVDKLVNDPGSRRIIINSWNPSDFDKMALPPCHVLFQLHVREGKFLDGQLYQRSADIGLGLPFNITSYCLLLHILAKATGKIPGRFYHTIGNAHIYIKHREALEEQFSKRLTTDFPKLEILKDAPDKNSTIEERISWIEQLDWSDMKIENYKPYPPIKMELIT